MKVRENDGRRVDRQKSELTAMATKKYTLIAEYAD